ncbi:acetolactate synthase large subunit [Kribbella albertanoniae]|uniref:acetolactate synthase large subunit n=1 Tax=Kribbella albertanoniae TaxID=1266829 RepID=UPI001405602A|nr:acetolactate synthase large subunit [Kribbella albertanoniae]
MNGAEALVETLRLAGLQVCFTNPGSSELELLAAGLSSELHTVLCLEEGIATGAADGFARMSGVPAATLLHQGPGLANGLANLHNAKRALSPVVNLVGASATTHHELDGPLECDIEILAGPMSGWVRTVRDARLITADTRAAIVAAHLPTPGVATLIVPSDLAAAPSGGAVWDAPGLRLPAPSSNGVDELIPLLHNGSGDDVTVLLGGTALDRHGLSVAAQVCRTLGWRPVAEAFPRLLAGGPDSLFLTRLAADPAVARRQLAGTRHLVLAGARLPVTAFAQQGAPGTLAPADCRIWSLAAPNEDATAALLQLADASRRSSSQYDAPTRSARRPPLALPTVAKPLTTELLATVVAMMLPENAVVVDETNSSGPEFAAALREAPPHDLLTGCGFAIGQGLPLAVGAAIAVPDRRVVCLESDGSAMYALAAFWSQAHEDLNVTTIILNNRGYGILRRIAPAPTTGFFDLSAPEIDYVSVAAGLGVPGARVRTTAELRTQLGRALTHPGPYLIDAELLTIS